MKRLLVAAVFAVLVALPILYAQETAPKYVGVDKCKMCHSDQYDVWAKRPMSKAYESLVMVGDGKNEKCLSCHTTGYGKDGGFKDAESTPGLKGVTCEACHGPGEKYMKSMMSGQGGGDARENAKKACTGCHTDAIIHGDGHKGMK